MASGKAAQHGRGGHRKVRRHSTPERINTARPDEEHLNVALEQVNALEELPASEVGFPFSDLPTVRRLYHEAYELTDGPAAVQAQMPFVQRPKCSAPLKKGECFTFGARQHQEINAQREKQPPIQRQSLLQQSSPRSQGTADGGKRSFVASVDETHRYLLNLNYTRSTANKLRPQYCIRQYLQFYRRKPSKVRYHSHHRLDMCITISRYGD